ncbi:MAG: glycosyltransferase family 4 protein, partial [Syntrophaceae bacterium]|nr:glycosyltransferase family 4 protein [Syntrophaceae bacterium]
EIGGGGHSLNYLMRYLNRERFEPILLSPPGPIFDLAVKAGIRTFPYTFRKRYVSISIGNREIPVNPYRLMYRLADAFRIIRIIRQEKIDIVHTNNLDAHLTGWFLNKIFGIPVIWHIRTIWPQSFYKIPWPTRIIFVSQAVKKKALGGENSYSRALVIYNGIDPADFVAPEGARESILQEFRLPDRPIVGIVGRLAPWKRYDLFLQTAALLKKQGIDGTWVIVGSEVENRSGTNHTLYLRNLTKQLKIEDRVIFTGLRHDIPSLVGSFDVFVSASDDDPNPRTVLEAMAAGKPIVATNSGGVPEMLDNGRAGILVEKGNAHALAQGVLYLIQNPALAKELGQAALQRAKTVYSIQEHARKIEHLYEDILSR